MRTYAFQHETKSYLNRLERERGIRISAQGAHDINDRVEGLKKSGDWDKFSLGFNDRDADEYLSRAGVNNVRGCCEISLFVRGIKSLSLWNNMVCWPMRDYQNAGTGSTVYSLGGIGVYNGTMVNSPMWSNIGVISSLSTSSGITTSTPRQLFHDFGSLGHISSNQSTSAPYFNRWFPWSWNYLGFTYTWNDVPTLQGPLFSGDPTGGQNTILNIYNPVGNDIFISKCFSWSNEVRIMRGFMHSLANGYSHQTANQTRYLNGNTTNHILLEGSRTMTIGYVIKSYFNEDVYKKYFDLYKQTLGPDLDLP